MLKRILYIFFFLSLSACSDTSLSPENSPQPEEEELPPPPCFEENYTRFVENADSLIPLTCIRTIDMIPLMNYYYTYPVFNPNNPLEIAYIRRDIESNLCNQQIWTFNLCTGKKHKIADNACFFLDWSVKGWLVYTGTGTNIFKVKSNGDSLIQLTNAPGLHQEPRWNGMGNKIVYKNWNDGNTTIFLADENGKTLNSISSSEFTVAGLNWKDEKITGMSWINIDEDLVGIGEIDFSQKLFIPFDAIYLYDFPSSLYHAGWPSFSTYIGEMNSLFYGSNHNFIVYNVDTKSRTIIATGADNRQYDNAAISPDGNTVLYERIDRNKIDDCTMEYTERLFLMDIDGSNERVIEIPE